MWLALGREAEVVRVLDTGRQDQSELVSAAKLKATPESESGAKRRVRPR